MTLVDVKLSLASVSLCNWVLKLEIVLWYFMVFTIGEREKKRFFFFLGAIKASNERNSFV
jgi:hypothetical protein